MPVNFDPKAGLFWRACPATMLTHTLLNRGLSGLHRGVVYLAWCLAWLCAASPASAQSHFDVWTAGDGLPQNIIRGIRQSADGYLWLATLDGLARFDGVRFVTYNKANSPGIASNRFGFMVQTTDGDLWLVAEGSGVTRLHQGVFETYGASRGIPGGVVSGINADHAGHVWILAANRILIWRPEAGRFAQVDSPQSLHFTASPWTNGGFWARDGREVLLFQNGIFTHYAIPPELQQRQITHAGIDPDTSFFMETREGLQGRVYPLGHAGPASMVGKQATTWTDRTGHAWTMPLGLELRRYLGDVADVPGGRIAFNCFFEDRQGNIWLGTEGQGLYRFKRQVIRSYSTKQGLPSRNVYPVLGLNSGDVLAGAWDSGISRFHAGQFVTIAAKRGELGRKPTALFEDRSHQVWVGSLHGLGILRQDHIVAAAQPFLPPESTVQAIQQAPDGTMWFGTNHGLVRFAQGQSHTYTHEDGLATDDVRALYWSRNGDLWIGGYGGLSRLHGDRFEKWFESNGLPSNTIRSLYEDGRGTLWIGTYDHGLGRFANGRFTRYDTANGLYDNGAFGILEDSRGNLWMSSNRGIYSVALAQLDALAEGRLDEVTSVPYGKGDGMLNIECNGGAWPSAVKAPDGELWFPTQDGLAVADPSTVSVDLTPPPVIIESVRVDGSPTPLASGLRLPADRTFLEIGYTSTSLVKPLQIHFRYRLNGLETTWNDAGTRRTAYYSHVPPGSYTFQVIAGNSDGTWNTVGQSLPVIVLPPFYRTWWFEAAVAFALLLLFTLAWQWRVDSFRRQAAQQKAFSTQLITSQEAERKRLAAELHDGVGQRLVVIRQLAQQIESRSKAGECEPDLLSELSVETKAAIQETREISYGLRPFQLDLLGLTKSIAGLIRSATQASGIKVVSELDDIDDFFPEARRIDMFRIVQECFNNILKHSHATEVSVRLQRTPARLLLKIEDNGEGFAQTSDRRTDGTGFGLHGMRERAYLLGGKLSLQSVPGSTLVTLEVRTVPQEAVNRV